MNEIKIYDTVLYLYPTFALISLDHIFYDIEFTRTISVASLVRVGFHCVWIRMATEITQIRTFILNVANNDNYQFRRRIRNCHFGHLFSFRNKCSLQKEKNLCLLKWDFKSLSLPFRLIKTFIFLANITSIRWICFFWCKWNLWDQAMISMKCMNLYFVCKRWISWSSYSTQWCYH